MAEKVLNTRIQLKYDTLARWTQFNPVLKTGEVAIATLATSVDTSAVNPDNGTHPVLMKVGPGNFNSLPWMSALAADVYSWAKSKDIKVEGAGNAVTGVSVVTNADNTTSVVLNKEATFATKAEFDEAIEGLTGGIGSIVDNDHQYSFEIPETGDDKGKLLIKVANFVNGKKDGEYTKLVAVDFVTPAELGDILEGYITNVVPGNKNGDVFDINVKDTVATIDFKLDNAGNVTFAATAEGLRGDVDLTHNHDDEYKKLQNKVDNTTNKTKIITSLTQNKQGVIVYTAENLTHESIIDFGTAVKAVEVDKAVEASHVAHKLSINGQEYDGSEKVDVTIDAASLGLDSAMHFIGAFAVAPEKAFDGASNERDLANGDVYLNTANATEYVYSNGKWVELGNEGSHALKSVKIEGTGYLTGGGDLTQNRTIDIADAVKTKIDNGATAYDWGNHADADYASAQSVTDIVKEGGTIDTKIDAYNTSKNFGDIITHNVAEFATAAQGAKAEAAFKSVEISGTSLVFRDSSEADHPIDIKGIKIDNAGHADTATKATQDASGNVITETYATKTEVANQDAVVLSEAQKYADGLASNYATAAQGAAADSAVQSISTPAGADGEPNGLKAVKTGTDVAISFDDSVVFVFNCGSASEVI